MGSWGVRAVAAATFFYWLQGVQKKSKTTKKKLNTKNVLCIKYEPENEETIKYKKF